MSDIGEDSMDSKTSSSSEEPTPSVNDMKGNLPSTSASTSQSVTFGDSVPSTSKLVDELTTQLKQTWTTVADEDEYLFNSTFKGSIEETPLIQFKGFSADSSRQSSTKRKLFTRPVNLGLDSLTTSTKKKDSVGLSADMLIRKNSSDDASAAAFLQYSSSDVFNFHSIEHADTSFPTFLKLWEQHQVCDVVIVVGDRKFHAHRVILCATIPYFYGMFTNNVAEKDQSEIVLHTETELSVGDETTAPTLEAKAFELLLRYAYTGSIEISADNVQSILIGASFLGLVNVQQACADYLKVRLSVPNVLKVIRFAEALGSEALVEASRRYIYRHFEEISRTEDFFSLEYDEVFELLQRDELNIRGEEAIFQAVMAWTKHNQPERVGHLAQLLACVRLPLLSPEYLSDIIMSESLVRQNLECRDLIDEAKDYHLLPARRYFIQHFRLRPRFGHLVQGLIYAVGGLSKSGDSMSTVEVYNSASRRWRIAASCAIARSRVGVAVMNGKLYAIGGYNGRERLNTIEVFDGKLKSWNKVPNMTYKRSAVGAAALYGYLYVCGGYDGSTSLNVVEKYSSQDDRWTIMTPMNCHRSATGVVAFDGYIYAIGGHDGCAIFNSCERLNFRTNQWELVQPMLTRRCRLGVTAFAGKIYVCGGYDGNIFLNTAEVFDPNTGTWSYIAKMNVTRSRVALVANGGQLYAIGGYDGMNNLSSVEVYDVERDVWEFTSNMVAHEGGVGVGVIPDN